MASMIEIVEFGPLTDEQRAELEGDEVDPWSAGDWTYVWRKKERHVALRNDDGRLIASAGLVLVPDVEAAGEHFPAVGLGGVIVNAGYRGQGLARRVVGEALARARALEPAVIALFCHGDRVGLYERLGFTELPAPPTVQQPDGPVVLPMRMMWQPLRPGASWPAGPVVVHGLPY